MPESENAAAFSTWNPPECPFPIEYEPRSLDDIRLAVVDAFFSLPRGGAEIGGVLFGKWDNERLTITDYAALDCEHAFGPSFTLSPRDETRLSELLAASNGNGLRPVGWYHSHTRSEIFLSDADREIHRRFFPEPWQVALVLKPHTFLPTRAGFFFREGDGRIHAGASYQEFALTPLLVKPAPSGAPLAVEPGPATPTPIPMEVPRFVAPDPPVPAAAEEPVQALPLPKFLDQPKPPSRRWLKVVVALLAGFGLGADLYAERDIWLPPLLAMIHRQKAAPAAPPPPALGLNTLDSDGQLQIRWNSNSAAVQQASGGVLSIDMDGAAPQEIRLDKAHLLSGAFTLTRQTERVDVSLATTQTDGHATREVTTFMGKLPDKRPVEDPVIQQQRDNLAKQVAKMQADLDAEIARNSNLRKTVDELSKQIREQQRSRLLNQVPDKK
jgi:proteasome lid subunit RPN8/RPN11